MLVDMSPNAVYKTTHFDLTLQPSKHTRTSPAATAAPDPSRGQYQIVIRPQDLQLANMQSYKQVQEKSNSDMLKFRRSFHGRSGIPVRGDED